MTANTSSLELRAGELRLALRPDLGGAIAGLWLGGLPVLRCTEPDELDSGARGASYPLVPYSNRLGHRRFDWLGRSYTTASNAPGMPHSIHGIGWQRPWSVVVHGDAEATISLEHLPDADWPFAFTAQQRFVLGAGLLRVEMSVTNTAGIAAPVGLGWHPYFPKRARSRLHIELGERWEADATKLPTHKVAQHGIDADVAHLAFDHCFEGWRGAAHIHDETLSLKLGSSLDRLVVYTPPEKPYFAVEPVSHVNNAIHMPQPLLHGLRSLQPGESTSAWMELQIAKA
jgi:aldose 1-epimerase